MSDWWSTGREFDSGMVQYFRWDWSWNISSTAILLPSADSRSKKRKYVHEVLVSCLAKLAQEKKCGYCRANQERQWRNILFTIIK